MILKNKMAIVTGASDGLEKEVAVDVYPLVLNPHGTTYK